MDKFLRILHSETLKDARRLVAEGKIKPEQVEETSCRIGAAVVKKLGLTEEVKAYHREMSHAG